MYGNYGLCPARKKCDIARGLFECLDGWKNGEIPGKIGEWDMASWWLVQSAKPKKKTKANKNKTRECKHLHARTNQNINKTKSLAKTRGT